MKTYLTIVFTIGNTERKATFIRQRSAKTPTSTGAARMVAKSLNSNDYSGMTIKPSDISICRIEECGYASR